MRTDLGLVVDTWNAVRLGLAPDTGALSSRADAVGGHVFRDDGQWRSLPDIRESIRRWHPGFDSFVDEMPGAGSAPDASWVEFLLRNLLGRPELYHMELPSHLRELFRTWTRQTTFELRRDESDDAVLAALTSAPAPAAAVPGPDPYPYLTVAPIGSHEYADCLAGGEGRTSGLEPIAARATELLFDDELRATFLDAYDRHTAIYSTLAPARADAAFRSRVDGSSKLSTTTGNRACAAEVVYRALRLATYWRVESYLQVRFPGWRDLLDADVPLGSEHSFVPVRIRGAVETTLPLPLLPDILASLPVPARWVAAWPHWVEQFDHRTVNPVFADRPRSLNLVREQVPDERADREFAALVELAFDDVNPRFDGATPWPDAARMFYRAIQNLLLLDEYAASIYKAVDLTKVVDRVRAAQGGRAREGPDAVGNRAGKDKAGGAPRPSTGSPLWELDEYLDRTASEYAAHRLMVDPELLHHWASRLRADGSEHRAVRTRRLVGRLGRAARSGSLSDGDLVDIIDGAQLLAFDMTNHSAQRIGELFRPILGAARQADAPLAANIWRSVAIQHSKIHQYGHAQAMLHEATAVLDRVAGSAHRIGDERMQINLLEASQQVYLQSTGLHARIVEMLLSDPAKRSVSAQSAHETEFAYLCSMARHAMEAGGHAYGLLKEVKSKYGLPPVQEQHRAATKGWEINTRAMHMRTLLLMGTLEAAAAEPGLRLRDRRTAEELMRTLVDAVPGVFREATSFPAAAAFGPELTRIAMHYALLRGMRFMRPGTGAALPAHLTRPARLSAHHEPGYPVFDLDAATTYLIEVPNDAGILSNIEYEPVRRVLSRCSRAAGGQLPLNYDLWLRQAQSTLRRPFDPDQFMPGGQLLKPPAIVRIGP